MKVWGRGKLSENTRTQNKSLKEQATLPQVLCLCVEGWLLFGKVDGSDFLDYGLL